MAKWLDATLPVWNDCAGRRWPCPFDSGDPHSEPIPGKWGSKLNRFQALCVLRCVRPDKCVAHLRMWVEQVLGKGEILRKGLDALQEKHPCIKQNRVCGLFGGFDLQKNLKGDYFSEVHVNRPELALFKKTLNDNGAFTVCRGHFVFTSPPLIISEDEINEGIDALDRSLHVFDNAME